MGEPESTQPVRLKKAELVITLDLETLVLGIGGTIPCNLVGLDMARRAVDELKLRCDVEWHEAQAMAVRLATGIPSRIIGRV